MSGGQEGASTNFETLPTFYPPNDTNAKEDFELTQREFEQIKDALKQEEFRKLLVEYVEEVQVILLQLMTYHLVISWYI